MTDYEKGRAEALAEAVKVLTAMKGPEPDKGDAWNMGFESCLDQGIRAIAALSPLSPSEGVVPDWVRDHFKERLAWADGDGMAEVNVNTEAIRAMLSAEKSP